MEPLKYNEVTGYSYAQAQQLIGAKHVNYVRQLVSQGKIRIAGEMPTSEGSEVNRKLLSVEDVEKAAAKFHNRANDDAHIYAIRMTEEQLAFVTAAWIEKYGELEYDDLTVQRRKHAQKSAAKKKSKKAKAAKKSESDVAAK